MSRYMKTFDAFPKVQSAHTVRSSRGSYSTILMITSLLFLIWVEIGGFIDGFVEQQFIVDNVVRNNLRINLDISVAMPCNFLHTNVRDETEDRFLAAELLNYEGVFNIPYAFYRDGNSISTPELDNVIRDSLQAEFNIQGQHVNEDAPGCRIYGAIPVNRVKGDFHITAKGYGYRDRTITHEQSLNFTHVITEFSFGDFYPYIDNPLDMTYKSTQDHIHSFHYRLNVIPTVYKKLGLEIDTNQYSLRSFETSRRHIPGIFFRYDFEPLKLKVEEQRMSFLRFVVRLANIVGGILVISQWFFKLADKIIVYVFGERVARRGEEKAKSLLDIDDPVRLD